MIVDKQLVVSNRKKNDLMAELRRLKFRPFPKVTKAKAAGETEDVQLEDEEDEAEETVKDAGATDYDYLLGMAIWSLTKEKVCIPASSSCFHSEQYLDRQTPATSGGQGY
jgi:DNA topoisomerase-2